MMLSTNLQEQLESLWTTTDLCQMFDKTPMTIHLWRKNKGLPAVLIPGARQPTVRFVPLEVIEWARKNSIKINLRVQYGR